MKKNSKVIYMNNKRENKIKRKAKIIGDITKQSVIGTLQNEQTYIISAGVGLMQGLKYNGNFKRGLKAGLATTGVLVGTNVIRNIAINVDAIQDA